jgi:glycine oxidase
MGFFRIHDPHHTQARPWGFVIGDNTGHETERSGMSALRCVVLGAGLMGRLMAHALAQQGHHVQVHEARGADATGAAARVAAAMLAPLAESAITETSVVRMGHYAMGRWQDLLREFPEPVFSQRQGSLIVWHRQDAPLAKQFEQMLLKTARECPELPPLEKADGHRLAELEPSLAGRFTQGLYLPGEGQLDNRGVLEALLHALQRHPKVQLHWDSPRTPADFDLEGAQAPDWLIDCRGLGARDQLRLRGVRGEVIRLHAPDVSLQRPTRLLHPRYPIYIAPKPNHLFVIGATEIESEDLSEASVRSTLELLSAAYSVHPGFGEARILEMGTHARPTFTDNLPCITLHGARHISLNGLYRHGFLISPAMLDAALEWLQHETTERALTWGLRVEDERNH